MYVKFSPNNSASPTNANRTKHGNEIVLVKLRQGQLYSADSFVKTKEISFGKLNEEDRINFFKWVSDIKDGLGNKMGHGRQGVVYQVKEDIGMKVPEPKQSNSGWADVYGQCNVKENFILHKIQNISDDIAKMPIDLIEKDGKFYLITDVIKGIHPAQKELNKEHLKGILNKTFLLDINGIVNTDLQAENILIESPTKERFIDFGAFNILSNHGDYIDAGNIDYNDFFKGRWVENETNLPPKEKILRTFLNDTPKYDLKNYSDNPHLNIKSNVSNFEFRTIYPQLMNDKTKNPLEFFKNYLQLKSKTYHPQMINYLSSLETFDTEVKNKIALAIDQEKLYKEVFTNPSPEIVKTELAKIQLKWLANDFSQSTTVVHGRKKSKDTYKDFMEMLKTHSEQAKGPEKKYFESMSEHFKDYLHLQWLENLPDMKLAESENILKRLKI